MLEFRIRRDPALDLLQYRTSGGRLALAAELELAARALEEHDQLCGDAPRDLAAEIFLDQRERQIGRP